MYRHRSCSSGAFLFPRNEPKCVKLLVNRELSHILACSGRSRGERKSTAATTIQPGGAEPISTSPLFVCVLRFFQETAAETAKNESEVRTDGRFHSRDDQRHGIFVLSSVRNSNRTKPQRQTPEVLLSRMPVEMEQYPSKAGELENGTFQGLPGMRQRVFLPSSVWTGTEILQPRLCKPGQEKGGEQE